MHFTALQTNIYIYIYSFSLFLFPWHLESEVCVPGSKSLQGHADEFMSQYLEKQVGLTLHMTCDTKPWTGNSQPGSDRAFASPETGDAWLKAERGEKRFGSANIDGQKILHQLGWLQEVETLWLFIPCIWYMDFYDFSCCRNFVHQPTTTGPTAFWCLYCILIIAFQCLLGFCGMFLCNQLQHHYY